MKRNAREEVRKILKSHPDGLTNAEISKLISLHQAGVTVSLKSMPDVYIDRWVFIHHRYRAVYVAVNVPDDCPKPD